LTTAPGVPERASPSRVERTERPLIAGSMPGRVGKAADESVDVVPRRPIDPAAVLPEWIAIWRPLAISSCAAVIPPPTPLLVTTPYGALRVTALSVARS
jgi:hypothetical protein